MVRRLSQNETFHGTGAGQIPSFPELAKKFDLTERQAQCAGLLAIGVNGADLAVQLNVAPSTVEKHLAGLRAKFDVTTTQDLRTRLLAETSADEFDSFHCWPALVNPLGDQNPSEAFALTASAMQKVTNMAASLSILRDALSGFGVRHIYYCFVPLSTRGFLRGDLISLFLAPDTMETAFNNSGGLLSQPMAMELFNAPDSVAFTDINAPAKISEKLGLFYDEIRAEDCGAIIGFGFPSGAGFVGLAMTLQNAEPTALRQHIAGNDSYFRQLSMVMHSIAFTNGTLAALIGLTIREREAVSALARGMKGAAIAKEMKISDRALGKLLSSVRKKFHAQSNAEAVYKAGAVNALVFL